MGVRDDAGAAAEQLRGVLDGIDRGDLGAGPMLRARLEGAVLAFEAVARGDRFDVAEVLASLDFTDSDHPPD